MRTKKNGRFAVNVGETPEETVETPRIKGEPKIGITGTKKKKMCRILVIWYVLQYLYWKNLPDQARRLRRIAIKDKKIGEGLKKLIDADKCYPYLVFGESGSEYLDRILKKHPIAEMY